MSTALSKAQDVSPNSSQVEARLQRRIRILLCGFIVGLVLSGLTAFPLTWELQILARMLGIPAGANPQDFSGLSWWIATVRNALLDTDAKYPFLAYGTDWLAFAHLVIASAFIGPLKDPVRNIWVLEWAMIACIGVLPLALICGPLRGIPFGWQLIDCSFGVVGIVPLWICRSWTKQLEALQSSTRFVPERT
ncbi:MAG TPA: hypothetical protein VM821_01920 [Abditibacteriaceae bacterium]|jgi:hypothetical protein|nr:hypothetical protein [Abditibacteriaceae bacterium]